MGSQQLRSKSIRTSYGLSFSCYVIKYICKLCIVFFRTSCAFQRNECMLTPGLNDRWRILYVDTPSTSTNSLLRYGIFFFSGRVDYVFLVLVRKLMILDTLSHLYHDKNQSVYFITDIFVGAKMKQTHVIFVSLLLDLLAFTLILPLFPKIFDFYESNKDVSWVNLSKCLTC